MKTRLKSRRIKKHVTFTKKENYEFTNGKTSSAVRSLFSTRSFSELPNELVTLIMKYFNSKELMLLRSVCPSFMDIIDNNRSIWSNVSYQNMWPTSIAEIQLFSRGAEADNRECLIKLGLAHLYHYNLIAEAEKTRKEVRINALLAAQYFCRLDKCNSPKKPLTWMLIRPPWSSTIKSICLKQATYTQLLKMQVSNVDCCVGYNIGRILNLELDNAIKASKAFTCASNMGFCHATFENLLLQKTSASSDTGMNLQWLRDLYECALLGNLEASFEFAHYLVVNKCYDFVSRPKASEFCRFLFQNHTYLRNDKLEQCQPKINSLMRCILIDWLAEVAYMKNMSHQVLHAAVYYIDRFLTTRVIERTKLQLLGITCLLLAAKSHYDSRQVHILTVRESSWLTDQTYKYEDVVKMMGEIIGTFRGDLWPPTSWDYLNLLLSFAKTEPDIWHMAHYLHDMSLQFTSFRGYQPSLLACATLLLVRIILNKDLLWPDEYAEYNGFQIHDLANCASFLFFKCFTSPPIKDDRDLPLKTIREEYSSEKYACIAKTLIIPSTIEIKNRILTADSTLSCVTQDPIQFVVMLPDIDDTLNMSIKSIDYDGDCEDYNDYGTYSSSDEECFCVGRSQLIPYQSVDDSDNETTMDTESFNLAALKWDSLPEESFTSQTVIKLEDGDSFEDKKNEENSTSLFPNNSKKILSPMTRNGKRKHPKCQTNVHAGVPRRKRTRSNTFAQRRKRTRSNTFSQLTYSSLE